MKSIADIKSLQHKVARCIISNAPHHVDTTHVQDILLRDEKSSPPEGVTVSTTTSCCRCNITIRFDGISIKKSDVVSNDSGAATVTISCKPTIIINCDSYARSIVDTKQAFSVYNDMLQLAEKVEEVFKQCIPGYDLL